MTLKRLSFLLGFAVLLMVAPIAYQIDRAARSLPPMAGEFGLPGLTAPATVHFDTLGIPVIETQTREDAYRVLGYLHARDRLFQMDMLRRKASGQLAAVLGEKALPSDRQQRVYQFQAAATAILAHLGAAERAALAAYTEGVNAVIHGSREFPPEFRFLHYQPKPWAMTDSLLAGSSMFQTLTDEEPDERMLTVMNACLPAEVNAFLTPDTDEYTHTLLGGTGTRRPARPVPADAIATLLGESRAASAQASLIDVDPPSVGSNSWAINHTKTADGRAIVADDMHLPLGVPNIWYRAHLHYAGLELSGVTLPGLPLVVVGSNRHVAWGYTNLNADVQDLVQLDLHPEHPEEYLTPEGWRAMETATETIEVHDGPPVTIALRNTQWGPVLERPLLGKPVALRWTARDPAAVNLRLIDMDGADTLEKAMAILNQFGAPPQNVVLADDRGHIGWTFTGFLPRRQGLDAGISQSWANGDNGWRGYLAPEQLPHLVDPPEGYLATANNQTLGSAYPHVIGQNFANGYRAFRIRQRLAEKARLNEQDLHDIQLDTTSDFHEFYRRLALSLLTSERIGKNPELAEMEAVIQQWNGRLDPDSLGIALLARWRADLAKAVFAPLFGRCVKLDPDFSYRWRQQETPLRALLKQGIPALAASGRAEGWNDFLLNALRNSASALKRELGVRHLGELPWRRVNTLNIQHPFSRALPLAGALLDMPPVPGACNSFCVKVLHAQHGASERMVISPNHAGEGILQMPGGQSGHPLSPHFRDQQRSWEDGSGSPYLPEKIGHTLKLLPPATH